MLTGGIVCGQNRGEAYVIPKKKIHFPNNNPHVTGGYMCEELAFKKKDCVGVASGQKELNHLVRISREQHQY